MRVAAIDVGSNSIHMVVAQVEADGRFQVIDRAKEMVRLGRRTLTSGYLSQDAMDDGVRVLSTFKTLAERQGVVRFSAVATAAVRESRNGGEFVQRVRDEVGLRVKVVPGREEARLVFLGVRYSIGLRGEPTLLVDAGGGSVELVLIENDEAVALESVKLGVARLSERYLTGDRPGARQIAAMEEQIEAELAPVFDRILTGRIRRVIGTSGTLLNLVSMVAAAQSGMHPTQLHNFAVDAEGISRLRRQLVKSERSERRYIEGIDVKRVDFVVVGACLMDYILKRLAVRELVACTWALREGFDFITRHRRGIEETNRYNDPRRRSVARFARHLGDVGPHAPHTAKLALRLFDQLKEEITVVPGAREWLEYASLLHDVGHHIGHRDHQHHSYYLIRNGELLGFRPEEIQVIALTARYHRKAAPKDSDDGYSSLSKPLRRTVLTLAGILRVADALDRSHYAVVKDITVQRDNGQLVLELDTAGDDAELEIWEARRRCAPLEELLDTAIDFQVIDRRKEQDGHRTASIPR